MTVESCSEMNHMTDFEKSVLTGITRLQTQMEAVLLSNQTLTTGVGGHATRITQAESTIGRLNGDIKDVKASLQEHKDSVNEALQEQKASMAAIQASVDSLKETRARISGGWAVAMIVGSILGAVLTNASSLFKLITGH